MKFTSEDLAKAMGLRVGDKIKLKNGEIAEVIEDYDLWFESSEFKRHGLYTIIGQNFEIVRTKKKVGEQLCRAIECQYCPLSGCCRNVQNRSLLTNLKFWNDRYNDKEIYDILKARLDKEVEE